MSLPEQSKQEDGDGEDIQGFDFLRKSAWTDLQLYVEGKTIYVSKSFLATISPVFRLMFESDFKEKNVDVLPLPGKKYEDVVTFLQCVNPGVLQKVNYSNIYGVFPLAHEYQVQRLLEECKQCLQKELSSEPISIFDNNCRNVRTTLTVIRYCEICVLAENYNLEDLLTTCVTLFSRINAKWYKNVPMFQKISTELRNRILCSRLGTIEGQTSATVVLPQNSKQDDSAGEDIEEIEFLKTSPWTDIQLDIEGKTLYVSKSFLATISPVFRLMFESDFKEKKVDVLPLPGKKYEDVLTFLQCLNPRVLRTVNYADIRGVLPLAHEYQVQGLLEECKHCLLTELLSIPLIVVDGVFRGTNTNLKILSLCEICSLAEEYCLESLLEICVERFTNINVQSYMNDPMFQKISTKLRNRIFYNRLLVVEKAMK
ncbi:hypothetical protein ACJMK2_027859 [Sinanodonta woodiana]|uniref:BTB domain-containing protein n=1 Tax=Sinanodonta woodiana TaxID=1069815 RepID=A0ABD3X593_SINWO